MSSEYTNRYGTIRLGDYVMISPKVKPDDNMREFVDEQHPLLKVIKIKNPSSGDRADILLESWDGGVTERVGWSITPIEGLEGCQMCTSSCKKEEVCAFFRSILERRE